MIPINLPLLGGSMADWYVLGKVGSAVESLGGNVQTLLYRCAYYDSHLSTTCTILSLDELFI